jgi:hypothetical protein
VASVREPGIGPAAARGVTVDVSLSGLLELGHIVTASSLVAGLGGRAVVLARARRSRDIAEIDSLLAVADGSRRS